MLWCLVCFARGNAVKCSGVWYVLQGETDCEHSETCGDASPSLLQAQAPVAADCVQALSLW